MPINLNKRRDLIMGRTLDEVTEKKLDREVKEFVGLLKKERPQITDGEMRAMVLSATKYARELLKGRATDLYGMSLEWAISTLSNPQASIKDKKDICLKVLGHCLPTEIVLHGGQEDNKQVLFQMARPEVEKNVVDVETKSINSDEDEPNLYGTEQTKRVPSESGKV